MFHPGPDPHCDFDFGATANLGTAADGTPTFLGVGRKDGTYYSLDPFTGKLRWQRNVVFGGFSPDEDECGFVANSRSGRIRACAIWFSKSAPTE